MEVPVKTVVHNINRNDFVRSAGEELPDVAIGSENGI